MSASAKRWIHWLSLVRPPNLLTVPGDPLAGFVLASGAGGAWDTRMVWAILSAMALYTSGLILNDVADYEVDRRERPGRPLACGAVARRDALTAGLLLGVFGVALAFPAGTMALVTAGYLFLLILVYDFLTPRGDVASFLVMGLCRSMSVALGIAATGNLSWGRVLPWLAAAGTGLYVVAVSCMAAGETRTQRLRWGRWGPLAVLTVSFGVMWRAIGVVTWLGAVLTALPLIAAWNLGRRLGPERKPEAAPAVIGGHIRALILIQASYCAMAPGRGDMAAVILLCLWPLSAILANRFYAS